MAARLVIFAFFLALSAAIALQTVHQKPTTWPATSGAHARDDVSECEGFGAGQIVCDANCSKVLMCMGGSLDPIVLEQCEDNLSCNAQEAKCVNDSSSCAASTSTINCNALGMFPDPNSCSAYHICCHVGNQSERVACETGYAYNPNTTLCSKRLSDDVCTNLPIKCNRLGENNAFPGDPNIYYICVADKDENLYPEFFRCEHGGIYNPSAFTCVDS